MTMRDDNNEHFNLPGLIALLLRRSPYIIAAALVAAVIAGAILLSMPSRYTATANIQLLRSGGAFLDDGRVGERRPLFDADVVGESAVLSSPQVLRRVVEQLRLTRYDEFQPEPSLASRAIAGLRALLTGAELDGERDPISAATGALSNALSVRQVGLSSLLEVSVTSVNPERAAAVANAVVDNYIALQIENRRLERLQAVEWLSERLVELLRQIDDAEVDVTSVLADIAASGLPDEAVITRQIADLIAQRDASRSATAATALRTPAEIQQRIAELERALLRKNELTSELHERERRLLTLQQVHQAFLTRLTEARESSSFAEATARIVSPAGAPTAPSAPRRTVMTVLVFVMAGALASAIVLLLDLSRDGFKTARHVSDATGLLHLATLPPASARGGADAARRRDAIRTLHLLAFGGAAQADAGVGAPSGGRVVVVASALPGEGSDELAALFAKQCAETGRTVLLHGGRAPACGGAYTISFEDAIAAVSGATLDDHGVVAILDGLREGHDAVVVAAPPVLSSVDGAMLARRADVFLLAVAWSATPRGAVREALERLALLGAAPAGFVMTKAPPRVTAAFGYPGQGFAARRVASVR